MPEPIDLAYLMARANKEHWCVFWGCTTCGSHQMQAAFQALAAEYAYSDIAAALADVDGDINFDVAEWLLRKLSYPWARGSLSSRKLLDVLGTSAAGRHYNRMLEAKAIADARRQEHELRNDPDEILRRRRVKKEQKAEGHLKRLEAKKVRDAAYHARIKGCRE